MATAVDHSSLHHAVWPSKSCHSSTQLGVLDFRFAHGNAFRRRFIYRGLYVEWHPARLHHERLYADRDCQRDRRDLVDNQLAAQTHADYDPQPLTVELTTLIQAILAWLQAGQSAAPIEAALEKLNSHFSHLLASGDVPVVSRAQGEQAKIRLLISRMRQIRDTDFLKPAYALLEIFLVGAGLTLILIKTTSFMQNLVVSALLFTAFAYLLQLIRDLDNPFQYEGRSNLDVDPTVLCELRDRFTAQNQQPCTDKSRP